MKNKRNTQIPQTQVDSLCLELMRVFVLRLALRLIVGVSLSALLSASFVAQQ